FWTNASITKMSRPQGVANLVLTPEEAKKLESGDFNNRRLAADQKPTDQSLGAPAKGNLQANGNYNAFWWDPGSKVAQINGEYRSPWITKPPTGRTPYNPGRGARPAVDGEGGPAIAAAAAPVPAARPASPSPSAVKPAPAARSAAGKPAAAKDA